MKPEKAEKTFKFFSELLFEAQIIDPRYPVKGCYIWLPYGLAIREQFIKMLKAPLEKRGYKEYLFPRLVPKESIEALKAIVKNPEEGVFWITHAGSKKLSVPLFLYPTGECPIYSMFKIWIKTYSDLPIKLFQISAIFRPTKDSSHMINGSESDTLMEGHTAHSTKKEALSEFWESVEIMKEYYSALAIPTIIVKRPSWGNKPVSDITISFETYLPLKNRSFSPSVAYYQDRIFSKAFGVKFKTKDGKEDFTYQNTFGIAERVFAPVFLLHADEFGLCLLPELAPIQIAIVPIFNKKSRAQAEEYAEKLAQTLSQFRVFVDSDNSSPGKRFFKWRKKGVPIRIGVGAESAETGAISLVRRDLEKQENINADSLGKLMPKYFEEIKKALYLRAKEKFDSAFASISTRSELEKSIREKKMSKFFWCEEKDCGMKLEKGLSGEIIGTLLDEKSSGKCLNCGKKADAVAVFAQRCTSP